MKITAKNHQPQVSSLASNQEKGYRRCWYKLMTQLRLIQAFILLETGFVKENFEKEKGTVRTIRIEVFVGVYECKGTWSSFHRRRFLNNGF